MVPHPTGRTRLCCGATKASGHVVKASSAKSTYVQRHRLCSRCCQLIPITSTFSLRPAILHNLIFPLHCFLPSGSWHGVMKLSSIPLPQQAVAAGSLCDRPHAYSSKTSANLNFTETFSCQQLSSKTLSHFLILKNMGTHMTFDNAVGCVRVSFIWPVRFEALDLQGSACKVHFTPHHQYGANFTYSMCSSLNAAVSWPFSCF